MFTSRGTHRRTLTATAVTITLAVGSLLTGCSSDSGALATSSDDPIVLEEIEGTEVNKLTLTDKAAERLGIETSEIRADADGGLALDYAALMYDASGQTWVYVSTGPTEFHREAVAVSRIEGDTVHVSEGPEVGTKVVVVGAAELFGAEFDTAH